MDNKPTEAQVGLLWHTLGLRPECRDSRTVIETVSLPAQATATSQIWKLW
uniref:Uncharacterized protein n=1 Tax=Pseudomonas phage Cruim01 TaxID=3138528 RepID=A0AAU6W3W8_9VIRU